MPIIFPSVEKLWKWFVALPKHSWAVIMYFQVSVDGFHFYYCYSRDANTHYIWKLWYGTLAMPSLTIYMLSDTTDYMGISEITSIWKLFLSSSPSISVFSSWTIKWFTFSFIIVIFRYYGYHLHYPFSINKKLKTNKVERLYVLTMHIHWIKDTNS